MADRGAFNFKPWGQSRGRARGRGRGRSRYMTPQFTDRFGRKAQERPSSQYYRTYKEMEVNTPAFVEKPSLYVQLEVGSNDPIPTLEDTLSPGSSSSSKRSCTEIEGNEEDKNKQFVKRRCRKALSGILNCSRDGDGLGREMSVHGNKGKTPQGYSDGAFTEENWDEVIQNEEAAKYKREATGLKLMQDAYMSSESNEMDSVEEGTETDAFLRYKRDNVNSVGAECLTPTMDDLGVECLSNAITENCTCTSDEDALKCLNTQHKLLLREAKGSNSFSSPTAGSKARPYLIERSKSDSWITQISNTKRREKSKKRHRSAAIIESQSSTTDDETEIDRKMAVQKGVRKPCHSGQKVSSTNKPRECTMRGVKGNERKLTPRQKEAAQPVKQNEHTEYESEAIEGDVDSSQVGDLDDSLTDDEHWDSVVKKLSAGGVDTEDVPSTQSKIDENRKTQESERVTKHLPIPGPSYYRQCMPPSNHPFHPMDAPLQFRPSHIAQRQCHRSPYIQRRPSLRYHFGRPPPPHMWPLMGDPLNLFRQALWTRFQPRAMPAFPDLSVPHFPGVMPTVQTKAEDQEYTPETMEDQSELQSIEAHTEGDIREYRQNVDISADDTGAYEDIEYNYQEPETGTAIDYSYQEPGIGTSPNNQEHGTGNSIDCSYQEPVTGTPTRYQEYAAGNSIDYNHKAPVTSNQTSYREHVGGISNDYSYRESGTGTPVDYGYQEPGIGSPTNYQEQRTGCSIDYRYQDSETGSPIYQEHATGYIDDSYQESSIPETPIDYEESVNISDPEPAVTQAFIPRQVLSHSKRQGANMALMSKSRVGRQKSTLLDNPEEWETIDCLPSTEDNQAQYFRVDSEPVTTNNSRISPVTIDKGIREQWQQNWYKDMDTATENVGPIRRKSKVWGTVVKQMRHHNPELEYQANPPVTIKSTPAVVERAHPPSYAAIVSTSQTANSSDYVVGKGRCVSHSQFNESLPATQKFWRSSNSSFEFVSPQEVGKIGSDVSMNKNLCQRTPSPATTSAAHKFRSWSAGSQGWTTYNVTPIPHPDSAPPKTKTFAEVLQRPRRLNLEDEVRRETFSKVPSWRSSSESDEILEIHYPASDVDYIDSHCHIDLLYQRHNFKGTFAKFSLVNKFPANFAGCVAIFCYPVNFSSGYSLAEDLLKENNIWGSFGCHPHQVKHYDGIMEQRIKDWMSHPKTVALGEIGLDYSDRPIEVTSDHELQKLIFQRQLKLALDVKKPLVIHCRDAEKDTLAIMSETVPRNHKIHRHCFTGPPEDALTFLRAFPNSFIGLTALVTFPTAVPTHQTARAIPLNRLLLETDTPYFVPRKARGAKWSHPGMAIFVAERIAQLRGVHVDEVLTAVRANTKAMYGV